MYEYKAIVDSVYDADTITVKIDLGFNIWTANQKIRLFGIDAPEVRGSERPEGLISRDWLRDKILGETITLKTHKAGTGKGKYGRWLGDIFMPGEQTSLNQQMIDLGLAKPATY